MSMVTNVMLAALGVATVGSAAFTKLPLAKVGDKDVNVVNTPNVKVVNEPTVNVGNSPTVNVAIREAVSFRFELESGALITGLPDEEAYVVPAGKRLVVSHVSGVCATPNNVSCTLAAIYAGESSGVRRVEHNLIPELSGWNGIVNISNFSQPMEFVANSGEKVGFFYGRSSAFVGSPKATMNLNVSGYLETVP